MQSSAWPTAITQRTKIMLPRRIAFLGLGNMGIGMASNLTKAAERVVCYDPTPAARDAAAKLGLDVATSAEAAVEEAAAVVTMLPNGKILSDLFMGEGNLFASLAADATVLDCSTIDAPTARSVNAAALERGLCFMDTPVSGGTAAAAAGTLAFMCGGSADAFATMAKPILSTMGPAEKIFHAGPAGAGQVAKACNNMLLAIHMIGTTEALSMGARHGLDPAALSEIMRASSGNNWSLDVYNPYPGVMADKPASKGFAPGFMTDLMVKDLGLAMDVADGVGLDVRMGALAKELYTTHQTEGNGPLDFSSIINRLGERE